MDVWKQELAWYEGQLAETEVKTQAKEEEQKQAKIANTPKEYIDKINEAIDRLVERKKNLHRNRFTLQLHMDLPAEQGLKRPLEEAVGDVGASKRSRTDRERIPASELPTDESTKHQDVTKKAELAQSNMAAVDDGTSWVRDQLEREMARISSMEEQLLQALKTNMRKDIISIIQDEIERLEQWEKDLFRLYGMHLHLAIPVAASISEQVVKRMLEARKSSRTGRETHPTSELPYPAHIDPDDGEERQSWIHHVLHKQVLCEAVEPKEASWLEQVPEELVAARYLHFLLYEAPACSVADMVSDWARNCNGNHRVPDVPWESKLLPILKAAAGGQPGLKVVLEEKTVGDTIIQDIFTRADLPSGDCAGIGPKGIRRTVSGRSSDDPTGIHSKSNIKNHAKVFQVCWTELLSHGNDFVCMCSATLEALWLVRLSFVKGAPQCIPLDDPCQVLESVQICPPFHPHHSHHAHPGYIVPSLGKALHKVQDKRHPNLKDLVTALSSSHVPPGFRLAVQEAATQARLWNLPPVRLILKPFSKEPIDTSGCSIIATGRHSIVLRLAGADYVIKIGSLESMIGEELIHIEADRSKSRHIRKLYRDSSGEVLGGEVQGAGNGLCFLAMDRYFTSTLNPEMARTSQQVAKLAEQAWSGLCALHEQEVMHRDLKPENILIDSNGDLCINDLDVACMEGDEDAQRQRVGNEAYESFKRGDREYHEFSDDDLSLGLVLAEVLGIWTPSSVISKEAALRDLCERDEVPESMRVALKKHLEQ